MNQQGVRWTAEQVLALAPDEASRKTGSRLGTAGPWSEAGCSGSGALWGLCRGSGSTPYRTVVDTAGGSPACKCSCPSRKSPCKHALGLLLLWTADESAMQKAAAPSWADEWLTAHRKQTNQTKAGKPEAARRRAEQRAERITTGASELEQRLADLLRGGLVAAEQTNYGLWEETARRMVDAQAPGLAARVRELGAVPASGPGWPARLLEECALLHLLDTAWLGRDGLPEPLAATVRTRVGLTASAGGPPIRDRWLVLAQYDTPDGNLVVRRIWLYGRESRRMALILSFGAAGRAPEIALPAGVMLDTELTYYPGAGQLRADMGNEPALPLPIDAPPPGVGTTEAIHAYANALSDDPWLDSWPVTLSRVIPVPSGDAWQLADAQGNSALPVTQTALSRPNLWKLAALSGGGPVTVFGECGHRGFTPLTAWAGSAEPVPLTET
ncbi:SWIM zinc finger family protein [Streptomyces sp. NPDC002994]|uniref:SWIM zinc finger family protein n=1 Tax=Streptomyces sp. NPDC002994 TaxID=3154441 RepID=UPI0033B9DB5E